jgi:flagellar hook-length control protein FliK
MNAMTANLRVATPVQVAVARDKPAEKEPSGEEHFSNMLSQRQTRDDAPSTQHTSAPKPKTSEPAKSKDAKPGDTLHLLQTSTAIQPTVTPPVQTEPSVQPAAETVDDVLSKSATKAVPQAPIAGLVAQTTPATANATTDTTTSATTTDAALKAIVPSTPPATTVATPAADTAALVKTMTPVATTTVADKPSAAVPRAASPSQRAFVPSTLTADAPAITTPQTTDKTAAATPAAPSPVSTTPSSDAQPITIEAAKQTTAPDAQQPAILATQLDFSNAAPTIIATAVAAAVAHPAMSHDDTPDDSLDSTGATTPTGATATFTLPEQRDVATVDGKAPVLAPSSPQFGDALGAKLTWMAERHIGHAEIRLSPEDLGTVDVRVRLNGEHVRAEFASANSDVRQAINDHLPRLRDMLSQHGFNLAESHVGNGSSQQTTQNKPDDTASSPVEEEVALPAAHVSAYTHDGILDAFA